MFHLENNKLKIDIASRGAELKSIFHKQHSLEYLWQGDPAFWAKSSPVLFPVVGQLKSNAYRYNEKEYHLPRHGFAREKEFTVEMQSENAITFLLESNGETLEVYPFTFLFSITYSLHDDSLTTSYHVQNKGNESMLFSVGGHPAFNVPLVKGTAYTDYRLTFNQKETAGRWPISPEGLIETTPEPLLQDSEVLPLAKKLFEKDAVVLKHLLSDEVALGSDKTPHGLRFKFSGFPFLGLWAAPGADFLCIEPWCGIADSVTADGELVHKEGINQLQPGETLSVEWQAMFY